MYQILCRARGKGHSKVDQQPLRRETSMPKFVTIKTLPHVIEVIKAMKLEGLARGHDWSYDRGKDYRATGGGCSPRARAPTAARRPPPSAKLGGERALGVIMNLENPTAARSTARRFGRQETRDMTSSDINFLMSLRISISWVSANGKPPDQAAGTSHTASGLHPPRHVRQCLNQGSCNNDFLNP